MDLDEDDGPGDVRPLTGVSRPRTQQSSRDEDSFDRPVTGMSRPRTSQSRIDSDGLEEGDSTDVRPVTGMSRPRTQAGRGGDMRPPTSGRGMNEDEDVRPTTGYRPAEDYDEVRPMTNRGGDSRPRTGGRLATGMLRPLTREGNRMGDTDDDVLNSMMDDNRPLTGRGGSGRFKSGGLRRADDFESGLDSFDRPTTSGSGSMMDRPPTSRGPLMGGRPATRQGTAAGQRPITGGAGRLGTANRPPGTATRLTTAMLQRTAMSGTSGGAVPGGVGVGLNAQVNVVDRPITQQGLGGLRTAGKTGRGPNRQIQDKSYFMGLLRTKVGELQGEIGKMSKEIDDFSKEQSTYLIYDKRVKELAAEWNELQGELADYNLLVDKLNTDAEIEEIQAEVADLKAHNNEEAAAVDEIFAEKQEKEKIIRALEAEIEQERNLADNLIGSMDSRVRDEYATLQSTNSNLLGRFEALQQEMDAVNARKAQLEGELSMSHVKQDAVKLYEQLAEIEEEYQRVLAEDAARGTPAQERDRLLRQVKDDNAEIAAMERQATEIGDEIKALRDEAAQIDADLEESQSERSHKYRELRKREETMDQFLETFESTKKEEEKRLAGLESQVVTALERVSRALSLVDRLPNPKDYGEMKDELSFKEGELRKSRSTVEGLAQEKSQLQANLEKIEALEEKVTTEMAQLKEKRQKMVDEMAVYSRPEVLKREAEEKENELNRELAELEKEYKASSLAVKELSAEHDRLKKSLEENETYSQLRNLERKWSNLEQNNYAIKTAIQAKQAEANVGAIKSKVFAGLKDYNRILQEAMSRGGI